MTNTQRHNIHNLQYNQLKEDKMLLSTLSKELMPTQIHNIQNLQYN